MAEPINVMAMAGAITDALVGFPVDIPQGTVVPPPDELNETSHNAAAKNERNNGVLPDIENQCAEIKPLQEAPKDFKELEREKWRSLQRTLSPILPLIYLSAIAAQLTAEVIDPSIANENNPHRGFIIDPFIATAALFSTLCCVCFVCTPHCHSQSELSNERSNSEICSLLNCILNMGCMCLGPSMISMFATVGIFTSDKGEMDDGVAKTAAIAALEIGPIFSIYCAVTLLPIIIALCKIVDFYEQQYRDLEDKDKGWLNDFMDFVKIAIRHGDRSLDVQLTLVQNFESLLDNSSIDEFRRMLIEFIRNPIVEITDSNWEELANKLLQALRGGQPATNDDGSFKTFVFSERHRRMWSLEKQGIEEARRNEARISKVKGLVRVVYGIVGQPSDKYRGELRCLSKELARHAREKEHKLYNEQKHCLLTAL